MFKKILAGNSGKGIVVSEGKNEPIHYSSDSWSISQLCGSCETHLNREYETYSIGVLRNSRRCARKHSCGVTFTNIDTKRLIGFFVAVLWRAANSSHPAYSKVVLPKVWNEEIRRHLLSVTPIPSSILSIQLSRLIDKTPEHGISSENLKDLIMSPFFRRAKKGKYSFCFVFEGFFVEIFIPAVTIKQRGKTGFLKRNQKTVMVPFLDIAAIPELAKCLVSGREKFIEGLVTFRTDE